jgi:hypothetical protein
MANLIVWDSIKNYLLKEEECKQVHKMIWEDYAVITGFNGIRYKITQANSLFQVKDLMKYILGINITKPEAIKYL